MADKMTLVLGASPLSDRYSHIAVRRLLAAGYPVVAVGRREGVIDGLVILRDVPEGLAPHTVTLYLNAHNQAEWAERLLALRPTRIIFNPGAENAALADQARERGVEVLDACTLVMLATGQY
jgi:predicted CoA-binding protein